MNKMQYELQSYLFLYPSNAITKHLLKSQDIKLKKHVDGRNLKKTCPPEKREKLKKKTTASPTAFVCSMFSQHRRITGSVAGIQNNSCSIR
jgi:hypothetical protein